MLSLLNSLMRSCRDVSYMALSPTQRSYWHRRVGEALARQHSQDLETISGEVAVHFHKAASHYQAVRYYVEAAHHASKVYAYHRAESFFAHAIAVAGHLNLPSEDLVPIYSEQGRALELAGRYAEALTVYEELEQLGRRRGELSMECVALEHLVTCYTEPCAVHNLGKAEQLSARGVNLARALGDHEAEVRFLRTRMVMASHYGNDEDARTAGETGLALARRYGLQKQLAYLLNDVAVLERLSGWQEQGQEHAEEARLLFQTLGDLPMLADNLAQQASSDLLGLRLDEALNYVDQAEALCRRLGNAWNLSIAMFVRGQVAVLRGQWTTALALFEEAAQQADIAGLVATQTVIPVALGALYRELGDLDRAQGLHLQAYTTAGARAPFLLHITEAQLAIDVFAAAQPEEGAKWYASAQAHIPRGAIGRAWFSLADVAHAAVAGGGIMHGWEVALEKVEQSLAEATRRRLDFYLCELTLDKAKCFLGLDRLGEAERLLHELIGYTQRHGLDALLWKEHIALSRVYQAQGQEGRARQTRDNALTMIRQFAQGVDDITLRTRFLASVSDRPLAL